MNLSQVVSPRILAVVWALSITFDRRGQDGDLFGQMFGAGGNPTPVLDLVTHAAELLPNHNRQCFGREGMTGLQRVWISPQITQMRLRELLAGHLQKEQLMAFGTPARAWSTRHVLKSASAILADAIVQPEFTVMAQSTEPVAARVPEFPNPRAASIDWLGAVDIHQASPRPRLWNNECRTPALDQNGSA